MIKTFISGNGLTSDNGGSQKYTILATACVIPSPSNGLNRTDPEERLNDYAESLASWMNNPDPRIGDLVILENSGFSPENLANQILNRSSLKFRNLEIISYEGPKRPNGLHYGYSEFQMIDDLLDSSVLIGDQFIKTTGRYYFPTISNLIDNSPDYFNFICDSIVHPSIPLLNRSAGCTARMGLFLAKKSFFKEKIRYLYRDMHPVPRFSHIDDLIFDTLLPYHGVNGIFLRFSVNCEPIGIGGNGDNLSAVDKRIKNIIRAIVRRFAPSIWL